MHFDLAFYCFLAPVIAPIFFVQHTPVMQLILTYGILASAFFAKLLGAFVFGLLARKCPVRGLYFSLCGFAFSTTCVGLLPTYEDIGCVAPTLLLVLYALRFFFTAGESIIGRLYLFNQKNALQGVIVSSLYQATSMIGVLCASLVSLTLLWRLGFLLIGGISFALLLCRQWKQKPTLYQEKVFHQPKCMPSLQDIQRQWYACLCVCITTGISYITYSLPFFLLNTVLPLIAQVSFQEMLHLNTWLLLLDVFCMVWVGQQFKHYQPKALMSFAASVLSLSCPVLFYFLPSAPIAYITSVRIWLVFWGCVFACPLHFYHQQLFQTPSKDYVLFGLSTVTGSALLGKLFPIIFLGLWYYTESLMIIAVVIALIMAGGFFLLINQKNEK